jgi:uncharacterized protein YecE (DUF72 family)
VKDLQSWRTNNNMDFVFCVKHVMAVTDFEHRPSLTLEEFDEILDRCHNLLRLIAVYISGCRRGVYCK